MMLSKFKFILLLVLGGTGANLLNAVVRREHVTVGASGVVFVMLGALMLWFIVNFYRMGLGDFNPCFYPWIVFLAMTIPN